MDQSVDRPSPRPTSTSDLSNRGTRIQDEEVIHTLGQYSLEDIVELKIAKFLAQMGDFSHENMYALILAQVEKPLLLQVLRHVGGNQVQAAKMLGINRNTLRKKTKQYGL